MAARLAEGAELHPLRVGGLRPNQLLHTYGVGAMADLPNLSVVMLGWTSGTLSGPGPCQRNDCSPQYGQS